MVALFGGASFLSAALLFLVEPMYGKLLLPSYGGSAAVWNTCVFFFQLALLVGYAYAHITRHVRGQRVVHAIVLGLAALVLPLHLPLWAPPPASQTVPVFHLVLVLIVSIGLPFAALSATAPLLQYWFSRTSHLRARDPYFLYAAGNAGSLVGLLVYPTLVEPILGLQQQRIVWSIGYGVVVTIVVGCAVVTARSIDVRPEHTWHAPRTPVAWTRRVRWLLLAAVPSSLMLGTTTHMTADVAPVPLLWVIPLGIYLATFIAAFAGSFDRLRRFATLAAPGLGIVLAVQLTDRPLSTGPELGLDLLVLAVFAFASHSAVAADRPASDRLTEFYIIISLGGVVGGSFNALIAPVAFDHLLEYPLAAAVAIVLLLPRPVGPSIYKVLAFSLSLIAALGVALMLSRVNWSSLPLAIVAAVAVVSLALIATRGLAGIAIAAVAVLAIAMVPEGGLLQDRTFYGIYRVVAAGDEHTLFDGSVIHGAEAMTATGYLRPQTYYTKTGPLGMFFQAYADSSQTKDVAVIGLGAASIAAYSNAGDKYTFYELDPEVVKIAEEPRFFTFLQRARGHVRVVVGDGRLQISKAGPSIYGVIILDAFTSDAIPVHLLTTNALRIYERKLRPDGMLVFHITNRYLDLAPILTAVAHADNLAGVVCADRSAGGPDRRSRSTWAVLTKNTATLDALRATRCWQSLPRTSGPAWTDDFSNVLAALK